MPNNPGVYYVHIEIKGEGLAFSGEKNINVYASGSDTKISQSVESSATSTYNDSAPISFSQSENTREDKIEKSIFKTIYQRIIDWIAKFLDFIF